MADFCPHFVDDVCLLSWHRGFREGQRNLRCAKCHRTISIKYDGKYVPWGESNDTPREVQVELAALDIGEKNEWKFGTDRFDYCPTTKSDELCALCESHYLAHVISSPDAEHSEDA